MSRTYRNRTHTTCPCYNHKEYDAWQDEWFVYRNPEYTDKTIEVRKKVWFARNRADKNSGYSNAPKDYRQSFNRALRAKNRMELIEALKTGSEDELLLTKFVHDVNWNYW